MTPYDCENCTAEYDTDLCEGCESQMTPKIVKLRLSRSPCLTILNTLNVLIVTRGDEYETIYMAHTNIYGGLSTVDSYGRYKLYAYSYFDIRHVSLFGSCCVEIKTRPASEGVDTGRARNRQ
jgi:hypothetical protein